MRNSSSARSGGVVGGAGRQVVRRRGGAAGRRGFSWRILPGLGLVLWFGAVLTAAASERITLFRSDVQIAANGTLDVTETLTVEARAEQIQRGIYRDFPTMYQTPLGLRRKVGFQFLTAQRDGREEPWRLDQEAVTNGVRIYLGREDHYLPPGRYTYTLRYRTDRQLYYGKEFDELYWNVTGQDWAFPIERAEITVHLPPGATYQSAEGYTGPTGAKGRDWKIVSSNPRAPALATTRILEPGEGFTVSVTWPKGYLATDQAPEGWLEIFDDNRGSLGAAALMLGVLVYYVVVWVLVGRDPPRGVIIPRYAPPQGWGPAAVRYVAGFGRVDEKSFTATVLQLAVEGALRIAKSEDKFLLVRTDGRKDLSGGKRKFYGALLGEKSPLELEQANYKILQRARQELAEWLQRDFEKGYFLRNSGFWLVGLVLSLVPVILALLDSRVLPVAIFMLLWLSFWTLGTSALVSSAISALRSGQFIAGAGRGLFSLPFLGGWCFGAFVLWQMTTPWAVGTFILGSALNLLFYHLLKKPTLAGRAILDEIEGFRHYLAVAEQERLDLEHPPERTPELFEKFLPYAVALDVEQRWAAQFNHVLEVASYQPAWLTEPHLSRFSATQLSTTLGGTMARTIASASTTPGSRSGSGGGGSSGGGGGGGGGGGW